MTMIAAARNRGGDAARAPLSQIVTTAWAGVLSPDIAPRDPMNRS